MSSEPEPVKCNVDSSCQNSSSATCKEPKTDAASISKLVLELKEQQNEQNKRIVNKLSHEIDQLKQDKTLLSKTLQNQQEEINELKNNVYNLQDIIAENCPTTDEYSVSNLTRTSSVSSLNENGYSSTSSLASSVSSLNAATVTSGSSSSALAFEENVVENDKQEEESVNPRQEIQEPQRNENVRATIAEIMNIEMTDVIEQLKKLREDFEEERAIRIALMEDLKNDAKSQLEGSLEMAMNVLSELNKD